MGPIAAPISRGTATSRGVLSVPTRRRSLAVAATRRGPASPTSLRRAVALAAPSPRPAHSRCRPAVAVAAAAAASLVLPADYGLVLCSLASTAALLQWLAIRVALARREYGVDYPRMYAADGTDRGNTFDCVQRSHQNTLETAPAQMVLAALLGLSHPVPMAAAQAAWVAGRVVYALGYSTGDPKKRLPGVVVSGLVYAGTLASALFEGARMVASAGAGSG